jgi:hypothetical protein
MIKYLPGSGPVVKLQALRESKIPFGIQIKNDSSPKWTCTASNCEFMEEPKTSISSKDGFADYEFMIRMKDSVQIWS